MLACPQGGYYAYKGMADDADSQLESLSVLGYRVESLAKRYETVDFDLAGLGNEAAVRKTAELLKQGKITIAEAAFLWNGLFVRADILIKDGGSFIIKEVKSSGLAAGESLTLQRDSKRIKANCRDMIYDLAFQTYVIRGSIDELLPMEMDFSIKSILVTPDPSLEAPVDAVELRQRQDVASLPSVFAERDLTNLIGDVLKGTTKEQRSLPGGSFIDFIAFCKKYLSDSGPFPPVGPHCNKCRFKVAGGFRECWKKTSHFSDKDFEKPSTLELSLRGETFDRVWRNWHVFQEQITESDLGAEPGKKEGPLTSVDRLWLQIGMATGKEDILKQYPECNGEAYVDRRGASVFMSTLKYPIHMIDFETCSPAIPLFQGQKCYHVIPFQFSHHVITSSPDGHYAVEHVGQFLDTGNSDPSFRFLRELKKQLEKDEGSIVRYSSHENTVLRALRQRLLSSAVPDRQGLIKFIESITEPTEEERKKDKSLVAGKRNMIDLEKLIKDTFITKGMRGRTSIKVVLPAILKNSEFLQKKYSENIYGSNIPSLNVPKTSPVALVKSDDAGEVLNPYVLLPPVGSTGKAINKGDAAADAYEEMLLAGAKAKTELRKALLRYCELDTMSMVLIWEYFDDVAK